MLAALPLAARAQRDPVADAALRDECVPLSGPQDTSPVLAAIGAAPTVLLGEATHGTLEFYRLRSAITRRLILDHGFDAVFIEGSWPAALRANRFANGSGPDRSAEEALSGFDAFPRWVWRNAEVRDWIDWLRRHNLSVGEPRRRVGFYGCDLQSLEGSIEAVLGHLERHDPEAAARARERYGCFEGYARKPERYGRAANLGLAPDCGEPAKQQYDELLKMSRDGIAHPGDLLEAAARFEARHNARIVRDAEAYYRAASQGRTEAWNLRDMHMADTVNVVRARLERQHGRPVKLVVWAHNSHVGDARATSSATTGEVSLGQLLRMRATEPGQVVLIGLTTYGGSVTAASDWGETPFRMQLAPSLPGSVESLFHDTGLGNFLLLPRKKSALVNALGRPRLQRAVGVVYRPDNERAAHYIEAVLGEQFDAVVHFDRTQAVEPLD